MFDDTPDCSELDLEFNATNTSIENIIRFVQDNIRYRSESDGIFTHTPKLPSRTLKKRAGDCKDKSTLLVHLLRQAGVEAHLALVSTRLQDAIEEQCPGPFLFDHMIIRFQHQGRDYFVDATGQKRGGTLDTMAALPYKRCLPITSQGESLQNIQTRIDDVELVKTHCFDFSKAKSSVATITIQREFRNRRADNMRYYLASQNLTTLQQNYQESCASDLGVQMTCIEALNITSDDRQQNILRLKECYSFSANDEGLQNGSIFVSSDFLTDLGIADEADHPLDLSLCGAVQHQINVLYPKKPDIELENFEVKNQWFSYSDSAEMKGNAVHFSINLTPHDSTVDKDSLVDYREQAQRVYKRSTTSFPVLINSGYKKIAMHMWGWAAGLAMLTHLVNTLLE